MIGQEHGRDERGISAEVRLRSVLGVEVEGTRLRRTSSGLQGNRNGRYRSPATVREPAVSGKEELQRLRRSLHTQAAVG